MIEHIHRFFDISEVLGYVFMWASILCAFIDIFIVGTVEDIKDAFRKASWYLLALSALMFITDVIPH